MVLTYMCVHCSRYLVFDSDEEVDDRLSQTEIVQAVDVTSASKVCARCLLVCGVCVCVCLCVCVCV